MKVIIAPLVLSRMVLTINTSPRESLEQWSSTAFLVAGGLFLGYAAIKGASMFAGVTPPSAFSVSHGLVALLVTVFGLFRLYPRLSDNTPRLSLAGVVVTVMSGIITVVLLLWLVVTTLQIEGYPTIPADAPAWTAAALLLSFLLLAGGFLLFGLASLRTTVFSRMVALLLLVPAAGWIGLMVAHMLFPSGDYLGLLAYTPISVALLAIGYLLHTGGIPADRPEPAADTTT